MKARRNRKLDEDARNFSRLAAKQYSTGTHSATETGARGRAMRRAESGGMAGYGRASGRSAAEKMVGIGDADEPSLQRAVTHSALTGKKGSIGAGFSAPTQDEVEEMITPGQKKKRARIAAARAGY